MPLSSRHALHCLPVCELLPQIPHKGALILKLVAMGAHYRLCLLPASCSNPRKRVLHLQVHNDPACKFHSLRNTRQCRRCCPPSSLSLAAG